MTLLAKLKADSLQARKDGNKVAANLLVTLVSEATMVGKNADNRDSTDEEVQRVVKKFLDNAIETRNHLLKNGATENRVTCDWQPIDGVNMEITILNSYMPEQLTEELLRHEIRKFKTENDDKVNIGQIMKHLQTNFAGQYDGKLASQIAKEP